MTCTWQDCAAQATTPQVAEDGEQWANLCDRHAAQLAGDIGRLDAARTIASWIKAQGGARAATARMLGEITG